MSIANVLLSRYDSPDFEGDYLMVLAENFANDKSTNIDRIISLFNTQNYETEKYLKNWFVIDREQAKKIYDFIAEDIELFTKRFNSYYVGATSLDSVSFGEQEEQLSGIYNRRTKKPYSVKYMQKVCGEAGYYVDGDYAYYDLSSSGLHIDLLATTESIEKLDEFLLTIKG